MKSFAPLKFSLASLLLLAVAVTTNSQPNTGSIKGTVTDQLGGLVVTATVVAKDSKGATRTVNTDANGNYEFRSLAAGDYDLTVTAEGFNTLEHRNVSVRSAKTRSEEHTSELQSQSNLVCRLLLEKKKSNKRIKY